MKARLPFLFIALSGFAFAGLPAAAQSPAQSSVAAPATRILAPVDDTNRISLPGNTFPLSGTRFDRGPAPISQPTGRITLVLRRSAAQQQALTQYLSSLQNPASPTFHKWLTPAQFGAQFGISDSDLQTVQLWLQSHGFKIEQVPQGRNFIQFSGTFDQVQSAFNTSIHTFVVNGETRYANVTDPQIPAALAPVVAGVGPLNNFPPQSSLQRGPQGAWNPSTQRIEPSLTLQDNSGNLYLYVDPADAATIYNTPNRNLNANYTSGSTWDGTGVNIGIVGESNVTMQDIENYRTAFLGESTSTANLPAVIVDGNDPGINSAAPEALLDNEVAGGLAPGAKLYFYTSAGSDLSSGLFNSIFRAVNDNTVSILSVSFVSCEASLGTSGNAAVLEIAQQAAAQGISVTVAAGDGGSAGCDDFDTGTQAIYGLAVNGLASTPYTIAVGGTDYDVLPGSFSSYALSNTDGAAPYYRTAKSYIPENPWNDSTTVNTALAQNVAYKNPGGATNIIAGSGGSSIVYSKPPFQQSLTPADGARDLPDVSLLAANGFYSAAWVLCSDNVADGVTSSTYTNCQNTSGQFTSATSFDGVGGTSAAAPAFAGMLALVEQSQGGARLGQADSILYLLAQNKYSTVFHDITTGNNAVPCAAGSANCGSNGFITGYNAGTGYDLASGLGSVNVAQMIANWNSVSLAPTATTLQLNSSTAAYTGVHGASVAFSVGVNPAPSGTAEPVAIIANANTTSGGTTSGPQDDGQFIVSLTSGTGSTQYNGLPGGTYTVYARYGGDTSDASSTSTPVSVDISPENSTTDLSVNAYNALTGNRLSGASVPYGAEVVLDAQIVGEAEPSTTVGLATGSVTFLNGSTTLGTGSVSSENEASWPPLSGKFAALAPGTYSITAQYAGDASYNRSTSSPVALTVVKAATTTSASSSPSSLASTGTATVSVTITTPYNEGAAGYGASPTGTVTLTANGATLATISGFSTSLQSVSPYNVVLTGSGTVQGSALAAGSNTITATYSGDANYAGSSGTVSLTVTGGGSSTTGIALTSSGSITVVPGATTGNTSTVSVTPSGGFTGAVNLTCAVTTAIVNPDHPPTCSLPSSVTISGTAAVTATLTVGTTATTTSSLLVPPLATPAQRFLLGGSGATLAFAFFLGIPARRRAWRALFSLVALIVVAGAIGCGGNSSPGGGGTTTVAGTTAGPYTVTVTGTDASTGKVTASVAVSVTVN